jgi:two-component system sensor histidine kinase MprB
VQPSDAAQLVRANGAVVPCYLEGRALPVDDEDLRMARAGGDVRLRTVQVTGTSYRMVSVPWHHGGVVQAARSFREADRVLANLRWRLAGLVAAAVLTAALAGWWFAKQLVRPLERLRDAAVSVASTGDLSTPVPAGGPGEVGSLAASFTTMMAGLVTSREQQKRLVADASHELRTPLTSLRTNIELLERAPAMAGPERTELLRDVHSELDELTELVAELVELATDRSGPELVLEPVRLAEVAEVVARRARRRSGRAIEVREAAVAEVDAVRPLIERVVSNLVENALKYSPPDTPVTVLVDGGRLEVRDRGPGIAPADQPHVFERFYRAAAARTSAGSGLGLAIVQQIVDRHGGRVWATTAPQGGAAVGFDLPVDRSGR